MAARVDAAGQMVLTGAIGPMLVVYGDRSAYPVSVMLRDRRFGDAAGRGCDGLSVDAASVGCVGTAKEQSIAPEIVPASRSS